MTVHPTTATLFLWLSNQSFHDDSVQLTVTVDGRVVIQDDFAVEGQHNWVDFPLDVAPGEHTLSVRSDSGAEHTESFVLPESGEARFGVMNYWGADKTPVFTWWFRPEPPMFG